MFHGGMEGLDKHFTIAGDALENALQAIANTKGVSNASSDGDNDSAEIIFDVKVGREKKSYILKLKELDD